MTIVSGFNYHKTSQERWVRSSFKISKFRDYAELWGNSSDHMEWYRNYMAMAWPYDIETGHAVAKMTLTAEQREGIEIHCSFSIELVVMD